MKRVLYFIILVIICFCNFSVNAQTVLYAEKDDSGMGGGDYIVVYFYPDGTLWAKKPTAQYAATIIMRDPKTKDEFKNQAKKALINQDYSNGYRYAGPAYLNSGTWRVYKNIQRTNKGFAISPDKNYLYKDSKLLTAIRVVNN